MIRKINRRAFLGMAAAGTAGIVLGDLMGFTFITAAFKQRHQTASLQ
jgi:hypothetical protein